MKITKMRGQQNSTNDLSLAQLVFPKAEFNTDESKNVQLWPPSLASSNIPPRRHLRFCDIKTLARLMGRLDKKEKEVILCLLDMVTSERLLINLITHLLDLFNSFII